MDKQPNFNVGLLGHVAHGKSTLVRQISKTRTQRHSNEQSTGSTFHLGYANSKIWMCTVCTNLYSSDSSTLMYTCNCSSNCKLVRHISFVDCPGHEKLMTKALSGTFAMDAAILMVSANEKCPQAQTLEHLLILEMLQIKNIIIVQNKLDLVTFDEAYKNLESIKEFINGTIAQNAPIIPISAQFGNNINVVIEYLANFKKQVKHYNDNNVFKMVCLRSFDINKPGSEIHEIKGSVMGGSIIHGHININDDVEISPGLLLNDGSSQIIKTKICNIYSEKTKLDSAGPGGLIALETTLDPVLGSKDRLVGQIIGSPGTLNSGMKQLYFIAKFIHNKRKYIKCGSEIYLTIGSMNVKTIVNSITNDSCSIYGTTLQWPVCFEIGDTILISIKSSHKISLVGVGKIVDENDLNIDIDIGIGIIDNNHTDLGQDSILDYDTLLQNIKTKDYDSHKTINIPPPKLAREGTKTLYLNFKQTCNSMNRSMDHVHKFILLELGARSGSFSNESGHMWIKGRQNQNQIMSILRNYVKEFVQCRACQKFDTQFVDKQIKCSYCCYTRLV